MASSIVSIERFDAILVLIGFPGSGKSETGNSIIGKRVFKTEPPKTQETCNVLDLRLTVRDTTGFQNMKELTEIYSSLKNLDSQNIVFGLTIRIGRFDPGFVETLREIFKDKGFGAQLLRRTVLIFTHIDDLLEGDEESYEDEFRKWLGRTGFISQLIASLQLKYCVIQNRPKGANQVKQVEHIVTHIKSIVENDSEQEAWFHINEREPLDVDKNAMVTFLETYSTRRESHQDTDFFKKLNQELKITPLKAIELVHKLQLQVNRPTKICIIHLFLKEMGSHMTENDVNKLLNLINPEKTRLSRFCPIL